MQLRNLFFWGVVLSDWVFVVMCFKIMYWPNLWGSLVLTLGNKHPVAEHNIAEKLVSKFLTVCWPSNGNICSQHFTVIHYTFPPWLSLHNSSSATLLYAQLFFLDYFFHKTFIKYSVFLDPPSYSPHIQSGIEYTQSLVYFKLTHFFMLETAKTYQKLVNPTK